MIPAKCARVEKKCDKRSTVRRVEIWRGQASSADAYRNFERTFRSLVEGHISSESFKF